MDYQKEAEMRKEYNRRKAKNWYEKNKEFKKEYAKYYRENKDECHQNRIERDKQVKIRREREKRRERENHINEIIEKYYPRSLQD